MATLRVYRGDQFVAPFELGEGRTRIGRGTENQLVLEDKDKQVSRSHAEIWYERGHYVIADLNSQNGVWIGERQIKSEEALPVNVPVTIGPYRLILEASQPTALADTGEMTSQQEAFVEPTQLAGSKSVPPASVSAPSRTHASKVQPAASGVRPQPRRSLAPILGVVGLVAATLIVVMIVMNRREPPAPPGPTPTVVETPPAPPPPVTEKSAEERFIEHFTLAQSQLEALNATGAKTENAAALEALPGDERGLAQQRAIEAILNPPPPELNTAKPVPDPNLKDADKPARDNARAQLEQGRQALGAARYQEAITNLEAAARSGADLGISDSDLNDMLAKAKSGRSQELMRERQAHAQKSLDDARTAVATDALTASQRLRDARNTYPELPGLSEMQATLEAEARRQGAAALALAKNRDNERLTDEAIRQYDRAIALLELLPGGHESLNFAKQRVAQLKAGK